MRKQIAASKLKVILIFSVKLWNYERENAYKRNGLLTPAEENTLWETKAEFILGEWYSNVFKNSKITCNGALLRP